MNPRITAIVTGLIILALGLAGLFYPGRVMGVLGFAVVNMTQAPAVLGEVRATYGGLFVVMGVFTLLAAMDPAAHRSRLLFVGLLWLGACAGRLLGVSTDGSPGVPGWLAVAFELVVGGALVAAALLSGRESPPSSIQAAAAPTPPPA